MSRKLSKKESLLTCELARDMFVIVGSDLVWRERPRRHFKDDHSWKGWHTRYAGKVVGAIFSPDTSICAYRFTFIKLEGKQYNFACHRISFLVYNGHWPKGQIDHDDGDGLNNHPFNLNDVTSTENNRNRPLNRNNRSGTIGVLFCKERSKSKWRSRIRISGKFIHLGYFLDKADAIVARKAAELKYGFHVNHGRAS